MRVLCLILLSSFLMACASTPRNIDDACGIFSERRGWYDDAADASEKWGSSVAVLLAFVHQESAFRRKAKPKRRLLLGFIPWRRPSSAYGYSQALDGAWQQYKKETGKRWVSRSNFEDAMDFIAWYNHKSEQQCTIKSNDSYNLYLAYHEGHAGYNRQSYADKPALLATAKRVEARTQSYQAQLSSCKNKLKRRWF